MGIYYITGLVSQKRLPDFYGKAALHLNYPNEWDRLQHRSGTGIFLHGTPSDTYSRPPLASNGCVVLANADLATPEKVADVGKTPVIIERRVEFVSYAQGENVINRINSQIDQWLQDVQSGDNQHLLRHYAIRCLQQHPPPGTALVRQRSKLRIDNSSKSLFRYPGSEEILVATFTLEDTRKHSNVEHRLRQYWGQDGGAWKILHEINI